MQVVVVEHGALAPWRGGLRRLFDAEYLAEHGAWDPEQPYGYAPADLHVVGSLDRRVVAHAGLQRRTIGVGDVETPLPTSVRAARGPALYAARTAVERAARCPAGVALEWGAPRRGVELPCIA